MRRNKYRIDIVDRRSATSINAETVNVTNVNNVTRVTNVSVAGTEDRHGFSRPMRGQSGRSWEGHGHGRGGKGKRTPRLLRYCASCGVLDQGRASRMSSGELCEAGVDVMRYGAYKFMNSSRRMAEDAVGAVGDVIEITRGVLGFIGSIFS